jgi:hypothetical protein
MNRAVDAYLAELEALRFSHSRRHHSARILERLILYLREAHQVTDWRAVNKLICATSPFMPLHAIARDKANTSQRQHCASGWPSSARSLSG